MVEKEANYYGDPVNDFELRIVQKPKEEKGQTYDNGIQGETDGLLDVVRKIVPEDVLVKMGGQITTVSLGGTFSEKSIVLPNTPLVRDPEKDARSHGGGASPGMGGMRTEQTFYHDGTQVDTVAPEAPKKSRLSGLFGRGTKTPPKRLVNGARNIVSVTIGSDDEIKDFKVNNIVVYEYIDTPDQ
ncbi:hypothetical protein IPM62_03545 [Candidatus Woesebacteria bacterium]|nr:MAG: hypothetical protein IPM62_03545 [Candidatus Woesebacteria bacterium]